MYKKLLILGGTHEAYSLVEKLISNFPSDKLRIISSLAGSTSKPKLPSGEVICGGFGGVLGLKNYLIKNNISFVINATHPFANKISQNAQSVTNELGISYFRLSRPPWEKISGDKWIEVPDVKAAANQLIESKSQLLKNAYKKNIFLSIGSRELHYFKKCYSHNFFIRTVEKATTVNSPAKSIFFYERGPFNLQNELNLLKKNAIKLLVSKNSGGVHTYPKIEASRKLNIPVIMIRRPKLSPKIVSYSLNEAIFWIAKKIDMQKKN